MRRRALLAAAALLPAACATPSSAPPPAASPRFGVEQFYALDPAMLRAAVLTDARAQFQSVELDITVQPPQQARYVILLQRPLAIDPRLPPAPPGSAWQVFALTPEASFTLTTVRQLLLSQPRGQAGEVRIAVSARPSLVPAELAGALPLRIDMLLDNRQGWFTQVGPVLLDTRHGEAERKG